MVISTSWSVCAVAVSATPSHEIKTIDAHKILTTIMKYRDMAGTIHDLYH